MKVRRCHRSRVLLGRGRSALRSRPHAGWLIWILIAAWVAACGNTKTTAQPAALADTPISPTATASPLPPATATSSPPAPTPVPPTVEATLPSSTEDPGLDPISVNSVSRLALLDTLAGHDDKVYTLAFSADGVFIASASPDGTIRLWDVQLGQEVDSFQIAELGMNDIALSPQRPQLASADAIWDLDSRQVVHPLVRGRQIPAQVAFSPDGSMLAIKLADRAVELWDVDAGRVWRTFDRVGDDLSLSIEFSPDGTLLATGGHLNGTVLLWDVQSGQVVRTFSHDSRSNIHAVSFSPDGSLLASADTESSARLWDVASGHLVRTLAHPSGLYDVTFSPDGSLAVTAGCDRSVKFWDVDSGRLLHSLSHGDEVMTVAFSPDGRLLASGGYDGLLYLWGARR